MRIAEEFDLQKLPAEDGRADPRAEILRDGHATGKQLAGAQLAAAVAWKDQFLIFALDGFSFEEFLHVHLLDANLDLLDTACIGMVYANGTFDGLVLQEPDALEFNYFGTTRMRLTLFNTRRWRIPGLGEPLGVWRPFGLHCRFRIDRLR